MWCFRFEFCRVVFEFCSVFVGVERWKGLFELVDVELLFMLFVVVVRLLMFKLIVVVMVVMFVCRSC